MADKRKVPDDDDDDDDDAGDKNGVGSRKKSKPYKIQEEPNKRIFGKKLMKKYNGKLATDTVYSVSITSPEWQGRPLLNLQEEMRGMWTDVLRTVRADDVLPTDLIRIHISHRDLTKGDITIPLQQVGAITVDGIMDRISTVLQSYAQLKADDVLEISVGIIRFPRGESRLNLLSIERDLCKKKSVTMIENDDSLCLSRSLVVCRGYEAFQNKVLSRKRWLMLIEKGSRRQKVEALELLEGTGLSILESSSMASVSRFEEYLNVDIVIMSASHGNRVIYPSKLRHEKQYYVYYIQGDPGHFHAVKIPTGLMSVAYFCKSCLVGHQSKDKHRCKGMCLKCKSFECFPGENVGFLSCPRCCVEFDSEACFERHLRRQGRERSVCEKYWQCKECRRYYRDSVLSRSDHVCDQYRCSVCERNVSVNHFCYQRHNKEKKPSDLMIFFDFETVQETGEHIPNLVVARRYRASSGKFTEHLVRSDDVREKFGSWLFSHQNKGAVVLAHNMKGFDGVFLLNYMVKNNVAHDVIYNGTKIMQVTVHSGLCMRIIDSLNFFPMPLSRLPKAFGLLDVKKGDFPHLFNKRENVSYIGKYPSLEYYNVNQRSSEDREAFCEWYESKRGCLFDFESELLSYCRNDVRILAESCLKFRVDFMSVTGGIDPFCYTTMASATMAVYKRNFLEEEYEVVLKSERESAERECREVRSERCWMTGIEVKSHREFVSKNFLRSKIALVPSSGYMCRDNYSRISMSWLLWLEKTREKELQHALSASGEYHLPGTNYRVDGYCATTNTVYEFYGCLYHGCSKCYKDENMTVPKTQETRHVLYTKTKRRESVIRNLGYNLVTVWEHEFRQSIQESADLRNFILNLDIEEHIDLRESFFGGRTNACRLYYSIEPEEKIRYLDFTSLYPFTNKYCRYPVGHPEIVVKDFKGIESYFGIAKVKILPPKDLYHPVLPHLSNGKLKFPLCSRCSALESQDSCRCPDEARAITGTWCTPEIMKALEKGYRIIKIYQVYDYQEWSEYNRVTSSGGLFADFVNTFLRIKQENSGWPSWCTDDASRKKYLEQYWEEEGVRLDSSNIELNSGKRSMAKLILNSFWGKFGQRSDMKKHKYVRSQAEFLSYLLDERTVLNDFHIVNEDLCVISYGSKEEFVQECPTSNVVIAAFTTCWARLRLYGILDRLKENVLYFDTDSVIFIERDDEVDPIVVGDFLGDLTSELKSGNYITSFVSGGPKNYAYEENDGRQTCKVKGFTLNYENSQLVNFNAIKDLVLGNMNERIRLPARNKICRNKYENKVYNRMEDRNYGVVYTKRRIVDNYNTLPFGYVKE